VDTAKEQITLSIPFPTDLKKGDSYMGTISGFTTSGVLIDIGVGYDGLIHHDFALSTWQKGDEVKVKVYKVDTAKEQIILSIPFPTDLKIGDSYMGTISGFTTSGVLINIGVGYDGFIHHDFALSTWQKGDEVKVKVYKVDIAKQQIVLAPMSNSFGS
jgi:small subunit ribosomal protein S1